jgi:hypothetical protein
MIRDEAWMFSRIFIAVLYAFLFAPPASARDMATVWFSPGRETPDFLALFSQPQLWAKARSQIDVFKLGPFQVDITNSTATNNFESLLRVDAFRKLREWGVSIAIEAPSIKEWDCSARGSTSDPRVRGDAKDTTIAYIKNVYTGGGSVRFVAMDEPMASGLGPCVESLDEAAANTSNYSKLVLNNSNVHVWAPALEIGEIEPYPSKSASQLIQWTQALARNGFKPAFFHVDIDSNEIASRGKALDFDADLRSLDAFFRSEGIPLGVIIWSGVDPEESDLSYYRHVMDLAIRVHNSIGRPEQTIFQSWVRRSSTKCLKETGCTPINNWMCSQSDPPYCGKLSVPINLPEGDKSIFSHTRLIGDVLTTFK